VFLPLLFDRRRALSSLTELYFSDSHTSNALTLTMSDQSDLASFVSFIQNNAAAQEMLTRLSSLVSPIMPKLESIGDNDQKQIDAVPTSLDTSSSSSALTLKTSSSSRADGQEFRPLNQAPSLLSSMLPSSSPPSMLLSSAPSSTLTPLPVANANDLLHGFRTPKITPDVRAPLGDKNKDFVSWSVALKWSLMIEGFDLFSIVIDTTQSRSSPSWPAADMFVRKSIVSNIAPGLTALIISCETASDMFRRLRDHFIDNSPLGRAQQLRTIMNTRFASGPLDALNIHAATFTSLVNQYNDGNSCDRISPLLASLLFITSVDENRFLQVFLNYKGKTVVPPLSEIISDVLQHEAMLARTTTMPSAFNSSSSPARSTQVRPIRPIRPSRPCRHCSGDHFDRQCDSLKAKGSSVIVAPPATASIATAPSTTATMQPEIHSVHVADSARNIDGPAAIPRLSSWCIDSAASHSYSFDRKAFVTYFPLAAKIPVRVGNGAVIHAVGRGDVEIPLSGTSFLLKNVLFVPNISANLISVTSLSEQNVETSFKNNICILSQGGDHKKNEIIAVAHRGADRLYRLDCHQSHTTASSFYSFSSLNLCSCSFSSSSAELLHRRLGHLHAQGIKNLKNKVTGLSFVDGTLNVCDTCLQAKQSRASFSSSRRSTAKSPLTRVSSDVGVINEPSVNGGRRFYVIFIDHHSRYVRIYFLREKSEVFTCFKDYKSWAENQRDVRIKSFSSDNGGEYVSTEFQAFLSEHGIEFVPTPPRTPELNGLAERTNRTLGEMARALLIQSGLTDGYWTEAYSTACYIRNRVGTKALGGMTPFSRWNNEKPDLAHLRVFGCLAYVHVDDSCRSKLQSKSEVGTFIGYGNEPGVYRVLLRHSGKIVSTKSVRFFEDIFPLKSGWPDDLAPILSSTPVIPEEDKIEQPFPENNHDKQHKARGSLPTRVSQRERRPTVPHEDLLANRINPLNKLFYSSDTSEEVLNAWTAAVDESFNASLNRDLADHAEHVNSIADWAAIVETSVNYLSNDPLSFHQAMSRPDGPKWFEAAKIELEALVRKGTYELVELPDGAKAIGSKWVWKLKVNDKNEIVRYKARLVAQGFRQRYGIDYNETFSPVAKISSIRMLISLASMHKWHFHSMDVENAYLHGELDEPVYMRQPEGFAKPGSERLVWKLKKCLYGLKQSGRVWNELFDQTLKKLGFEALESDHCVYRRVSTRGVIYLALYVDDCLLFASNPIELNEFKCELAEKFAMKDLGECKSFLGISVERDGTTGPIRLNQKHYIDTVLKRCNFSECNPVATPMRTTKTSYRNYDPIRDVEPAPDSQNLSSSFFDPIINPVSPSSQVCPDLPKDLQYSAVVGMIMYAMLCTRPDLAFAITYLSQFAANPQPEHWMALKRILRYLRGSVELCLEYGGVDSDHSLIGYADSDWGGNVERRSTTGYVFLLGGAAIVWSSKKQRTVALSSTEAEYMASTQVTKEAIWLRSLLRELELLKAGPTLIRGDNQGSIALGKNPEHHQRTKHIDIQYHFVRQQVALKTVMFLYIPTSLMIADVLTKPLERVRHQELCTRLGLKDTASSRAAVGNDRQNRSSRLKLKPLSEEKATKSEYFCPSPFSLPMSPT